MESDVTQHASFAVMPRMGEDATIPAELVAVETGRCTTRVTIVGVVQKPKDQRGKLGGVCGDVRCVRYSALWFVAYLAVIPSATGEAITLDTIAAVWKQRSIASRVEWRYDATGVYRFHHYQSDWVPADKEAADRRVTLNVDATRFRFEAIRWTFGEHGFQAAKINAAMVIEMYPERKFDPYITTLDAHFDDPRAELCDARPFLRTFDGNAVCDHWPPHAGEYPRGTIRRRLLIGRGSVPTAADPRTASDELQDLSVVGGILAFHPLHPGVDLRLERCEIAAEPVPVDGDLCIKLTESVPAKANSRHTYWLDPKRDLSIRRIIAASSTRGCQIDIRYVHDERLGLVPSEWTVSSFGEENGGRLDAARVIVTKLESRAALAEGEATVNYPAGSWVIDEPAGSQSILRADRSKRDIQSREFDWLPTHAELSATEPGKVGLLIESKLRWKRYWRSARLPALLGTATLTSAFALSLWRRRSQRMRKVYR